MGKGSYVRRQRGEGNAEYVILLVFVLICAVVGLFTSYSGSIKKMQLEKGLCLDCSNRDKDKLNYGAGKDNTSTTKDENKPTAGTGGSLPSGGGTAALPDAPPPTPPWWDLVSWWWG